MRIGYVQMDPVFGQKEKNINTAAQLINDETADLLVLPEFFNTGYLFMSSNEISELSEPIPTGKTTQKLMELSEAKKMVIIAGLPELHDGHFYNSAVMVCPDGKWFVYRKTHLFDREKLFFQPGNTGFCVFDALGLKIGIMICFDWIFPESARSLALLGADLIAHPSNLVLPYCPSAMVTRCLENRIFSITCNRIGMEERGDKKLKYIGKSRIIAPNGEVLVSGSSDQFEVKIVDVDINEARDKNINSRNNLFADRKTNLYIGK